LNSPSVDLDNPDTKLEFFSIDHKIICGRLECMINKSYLKRKAHLRPSLHPTSMHPGLIRACINLTRLQKGIILDPFCGSGGIIIEAGLMGFKAIGLDIDKIQINRAVTNLEFYKIKQYELKNTDALQSIISADAIVTDPPYGKASKASNVSELYKKFLTHCHGLTNNIVIIFPDFLNYSGICRLTGWKIKSKFKIYVHKSLTRIIVRLSDQPHLISLS
jgi:tRNA (guanine10-N2)-dimethyltransferase